ncbi:unnamed protein product [Plutella xylostella]|uniref:(diamondback moth) hypothetical protein n=1 Tax=Plutella xylostella TaxID=51655 RepID=A0A8S4FMF5_PLUXY|nr:unnamed protein product [Plutella xylostella]
MRQRFNELVDDAFSLFNSDRSNDTYTVEEKDCRDDSEKLAQARNDNVRLPGSPYSALDTVRGKSAGVRTVPPSSRGEAEAPRPRTSAARPVERRPPARAWDAAPSHSLTSSLRLQQPAINPAYILAEPKLSPEDPALPLISAIKSEIMKVRQNAKPPDK